MELLTGKYEATLDEKGRISFPAPLRRKILYEQKLFLGEGMENCLWLYPENEYNEMVNEVYKSTNAFSLKDREMRRWILTYLEVVVDKAGRIAIPINFREKAGLSKNCMFLGQINYIEIWDEERYRQYAADSKDNFIAASEELSITLKRRRGVID